MTILRASLALSLAAVSALPAAASAEDVAELAGLLNEPVVSTASKSAESAGLAPATTSVVTAEDLRRHGISTLDEAIDFVALGMIAEPSYATPEIGARGVMLTGDYGNHVLLLLDGHALNEPWDGTAYYDRSAGIPMDLVDHIEVILGPGSVLYGSSAMLGVINVITKRAKDYAGLHLVADGAYPAAGHLAGGYGRQFEWLGREGELTAGLDYSGYRGPRLAFGLQQVDGATWGGAATHRAITVPSGYLRLALGELEVSLRGAGSRRAATEIWGSFDDPDNWERDRWLSLDARWKASLSRNVKLSLRLYGDLYDYLENAPSASSSDCLDGQARCVFRNSGVSRWGGAEASTSLDWLSDGTYVTLVGGEVQYRRVTSWSAYDDASSGASTVVAPYDRSGSTLAAYLQQTLRPAPWLSVNAGLRLDRDGDLGSHLSPRVAAVVPAWRGGTLKAIYSEAFRAPTFYERYFADATSWVVARGLRPETVRSVEATVEQRAGADRFRLGAFRTWWDDLVITVPVDPRSLAAAQASGALAPGVTAASTYANASRVDSYGLNADLDGTRARQRLRYGAGLTLARSRQAGPFGRLPLLAAAQVFGNARASYDLGAPWPVVALAAHVTGPRPISGASLAPPPEATAQLALRAALSGPLSRGLSYRVGAAWRASGTSPYAVGPVRAAQPGGAPEVLPLPRFELVAGLRYDR
jgi:outer membrane receptor for ferrienterochelin and colicins